MAFPFFRSMMPLAIALHMAGGAFAQMEPSVFHQEGRTFIGALVLGANMSQIDGDAYYGYNKLGLVAGGMVYAKFSPTLSASMELEYSMKGVRAVEDAYSSMVGPYYAKYYLNINYVEVPLLLHYTFASKYQLGVGASYSRLLSSSERFEAVDIYYFPSERFPFQKGNVDFVASAGILLWKNWLANIRYQYSITPIRKAENVPAGFGYGYQSQMNNLFSVRLIYLL